MAVSLISEVVAFIAGSDLTPSERLVLLCIAEQANAKTRQAWQETSPGGRRWVLAEVVGLSPTGLRDTLQRLAKRGLELRVPLGQDKSGRTFYATHSRQTTFRVPVLPRRNGDGGTPPNGDGRTPRPDAQTPRGDDGPSPYSVLSRQSPNSTRARDSERIFLDYTDATPDEADAAVTQIRDEIDPRNLGGFLTRLAKAGDLQVYIDDVRTARARIALAEANAKRLGMTECEHGVPGGTQLHPTSSQPWCPMCRYARRCDTTSEPPDGTVPVIDINTRRVS